MAATKKIENIFRLLPQNTRGRFVSLHNFCHFSGAYALYLEFIVCVWPSSSHKRVHFFAYFIIIVVAVVKPPSSSSSSPTQQNRNLRKTKNLLLLCVAWFLIRNCSELPVLHLCKWISIYLDLPFKTSKIHSRCVFFLLDICMSRTTTDEKKIDLHRKVSFAHTQTVTMHTTNKVKLNFVIFDVDFVYSM